ncbi:MAG: MBL fold metallo-hydrolase [Eubacterium sp.]|nr:MBL fold metallo-hydrolase [Eubacterium sp.]
MYKITYSSLGVIGTNCYTLINDSTGEAILVDATGDLDSLLQGITEINADLKAVLLTHAHFDHIDAVDGVKKKFPKADVYIGENDEKLLGNPNLNLAMSFMGKNLVVKADKTVRDGEEIELIGLNIKCIEVPGHTIGGMCYYIPDLKSLFDGDTLFRGSVGRSDFPTGNGEDLINNIREKLLTLPEDTNVFPGHDSPTTIGREKEHNYYFS